MPSNRAFTLVELSIVLVILGLLVGGVLAGQSLIHAAELRSITTERTGFVVALNAFKEKYLALPGDMTNATSFWGAAHATPATCIGVFSTGQETCNGDGDNLIGGPFLVFSGTEEYEIFRAWQHLANAGLIEGNYTGRADYYLFDCHISYPHKNCPRSKISGGVWSIVYTGTPPGWAGFFVQEYGHTLYMGAEGGALFSNVGIITPSDMYNIDMKTDDGKAGLGRVLSIPGTGTAADCTTTIVAATSEYNLSNDANVCSPIFKLGF